MTGQNVRAFRSTLLLPVLVTLPLVMVACGDDSGSDAAKTSAKTSAETRAETRADNSMDCSVASHGGVTVPVDGDGPMVTVPVPAGWERDEAAEEDLDLQLLLTEKGKSPETGGWVSASVDYSDLTGLDAVEEILADRLGDAADSPAAHWRDSGLTCGLPSVRVDVSAEERQSTDMFSSPASVVAVAVPATGGSAVVSVAVVLRGDVADEVLSGFTVSAR